MARRAIEQYKIITDKDPKDVDSLVMLGRLDRVIDNSVDAEAAFKKVLAVDANNEDAITGLASVYSDRGDARTASELLEKLTKNNPSPRSFAILATNYESMHEYGLAADAYKKAIELDPARAELKSALAQDQALAGRLDDAMKTYQEVAQANPQDAQPYLGMARIYMEQRNFDQARKMTDKAKELDPDDLEVRYNEVALLQEEGKTTGGDCGPQGHSRFDGAPQLRSCAALYSRQNARCSSELYTAVTSSTSRPPIRSAKWGSSIPIQPPRARRNVIDTYRLAKDYAKAQQESDAAAKKFPNDRYVREVRAQLLADQGKTEPAIAELKKLLDGKNDRETYLAMAEVYEKGRNFAEMAKALDAAEKLSQRQRG